MSGGHLVDCEDCGFEGVFGCSGCFICDNCNGYWRDLDESLCEGCPGE